MSADRLEPFLRDRDAQYTYVAHRERPPLSLPYFQADVFERVELPGITPAGGEDLAMIFMHPCTMRAGAKLKKTITMIKVREADNGYQRNPDKLQSYFGAYPLADLRGDSKWWVGDFMRIATVGPDQLDRGNRIASLSLPARLQFMQRIIHHITRFAPATAVLEEETANIELEIELQTDWVTSRIGTNDEDRELVLATEGEFDDYMAQLPTFGTLPSGEPVGGRSRRDLTSVPDAESSLRSELARAISD